MDLEPGEPWWKQYLIPTLLSFAVAFSGWSVTQHFLIRQHDQVQEVRLATLELELKMLQQQNANQGELTTKVGIIDARQQIVLGELARLRGEVDNLLRRAR